MAYGPLCRVSALLVVPLAVGVLDYDERSASTFAEYARASFCDSGPIEAWQCGDMCNATRRPGEVVFIGPGPRYGVQGYVSQAWPESESPDNSSSGARCLLAIRGTADFNARNILADALLWRTAWPPESPEWCAGCAVHFGYASAYAELNQSLVAAVQQLNCTSLAMAGHSLGAGIVTLASLYFRAAMGYHVDPVWTFGKPRIGNTHFVEAYARAATQQRVYPPLWRVVHHNDIIPRLPPYWLGYRHEAVEIFYPSASSSLFRVCPPSIEEAENATCMYATPWYEYDWTLADHGSYMNQTFQESELNSTCLPVQPPWKPFVAEIAIVLMCMCIVCHECCLLRPFRKSRKPQSDGRSRKTLDKPLLDTAV